MRSYLITTFSAVCLFLGSATAQNKPGALPASGIKTNLLYDATATINLGAEFRLSNRVSLDVPLNYNGWTFSDNRKWKHFLVQPEVRWWMRETFRGSFFGLHGHYALYNVSALPSPPFSEYMAQHRFEGWLAGAGVSYGYRWNFSHRWAMEATVGVGYAYLSYDKYPCYNCGRKIASETKNYFGPTKAGVTLIFNIGGKKKPAPQPVPVYIPVQPKPAPPAPYVPRFEVSYITPEAEPIKRRNESGSAYIDYAAGKSVIDPLFGNNSAELEKIYTTLRSIHQNPDATITGITITGYASPEGTYATNMAVSEKRAAALKKQVMAVAGLPAPLFSSKGVGEDWAMLDTLVARSGMAEKYGILEIIRGTDIFDGREKMLMELSGGVPYRRMKAEMFPLLRRCEYRLDYTVLPFTIEKGKEVMKVNPYLLSLNEMFLIARSYPAGSAGFSETFEVAARIFPQSDIANLNAAACALERKDPASALGFLSKVSPRGQTDAYHNNMGIYYGLLGQWDNAKSELAQVNGCPKAVRNAAEVIKAQQ